MYIIYNNYNIMYIIWDRGGLTGFVFPSSRRYVNKNMITDTPTKYTIYTYCTLI